MEQKLNPSEIILNPDGSVYHLNLLPGDVAETIITVGDPERVEKVSRHFDRLEMKKSKREFITHTGFIGKKRITVISTGIGYGGVEIALTEIDQLFNVDFDKRSFKQDSVALEWIRLGTSGTISAYLQLGDTAITEFCAGISDFHALYQSKSFFDLKAFYSTPDKNLFNKFIGKAPHLIPSNTLTLPGFYLPQGRRIRPLNSENHLFAQLLNLQIEGKTMHHLEMESASLLQLSALYGHKACSISAILADRIHHQFHSNPDAVVDRMIEKALDCLSD